MDTLFKEVNKSKWFRNFILLFALISCFTLIYFRLKSNNTSDLFNDLASIVGSIATAVTAFLLYDQIVSQAKKDDYSKLLELHREFYNNRSFSNLFAFIDNNNHQQANEILKAIIDSEPIISDSTIVEGIKNIKEKYELENSLPTEQDLSNYMNFFNTLGNLIKSKNLKSQDIDDVFSYQIRKTLSHPILLDYILKNEFNGMKNLISYVPFFFYGTLLDPKERIEKLKLNTELNVKWGRNKICSLENYKLGEVIDGNSVYKAIEKNTSGILKGVYVEAKTTNPIELIQKIDNYEEVNQLYLREEVKVSFENNKEMKKCWAYVKR